MTIYDPIADTEIEPEKPITTSLVTRLRDNPFSAIREDTLTSGSGNVSKPDGANSVEIIMWGGGGGGRSDGSGGGGAGCIRETIDGSAFTDLPASIPYSVGAGGAVNSNGSDTTFNTTMIAGKGFVADSSSTGGAGGSSTWNGVAVPSMDSGGAGGLAVGPGEAGVSAIYGAGGGGGSVGATHNAGGVSAFGGNGGSNSPGGIPGGGGGYNQIGGRGEIRLRWLP